MSCSVYLRGLPQRANKVPLDQNPPGSIEHQHPWGQCQRSSLLTPTASMRGPQMFQTCRAVHAEAGIPWQRRGLSSTQATCTGCMGPGGPGGGPPRAYIGYAELSNTIPADDVVCSSYTEHDATLQLSRGHWHATNCPGCLAPLLGFSAHPEVSGVWQVGGTSVPTHRRCAGCGKLLVLVCGLACTWGLHL